MLEKYLGLFIKRRQSFSAVHQEIGMVDSSAGIASQVLSQLARGNTVPSDTQEVGMPAILRSSDRIQPEFLGEMRASGLNGYLIGVGTGAILGLVEGFREGPKGVIMADVNPRVVAAGRIMIDELQRAPDFNSFFSSVFNLSEEEYDEKVKKMASHDPALQRGISRWNNGAKGIVDTPMLAVSRSWLSALGDTVNAPEVLRKKFDLFKELACKGNIAMCYVRVENKGFLEVIQNLPSFGEQKNAIYISNILGLPTTDRFAPEKYKSLRKFGKERGSVAFLYSRHSSFLNIEMAHSFDEIPS